MNARTSTVRPDLSTRLRSALQQGEPALDALLATDVVPSASGRRDRVTTLQTIYGLSAGPVTESSRWAAHPAVVHLRWGLERSWLDELIREPLPERMPPLVATEDPALPGAVVHAMRWLAARDRLPSVYEWAARSASLPELVDFLDLEGGPDAGFDDLVAICQTGLSGSAKGELAVNYWDEMGDGDPAEVHTVLHDTMAAALGLRGVPEDEQPVEGLERSAFGGLLAANHWLKPEMLGALGLIELQAGPRCRLVLQGLTRTGAPAAALPFYRVHAEVDPRHGRDWLDKAIIPVVQERPDWAARIVRGAWWRSLLNDRFFRSVTTALAPSLAA